MTPTLPRLLGRSGALLSGLTLAVCAPLSAATDVNVDYAVQFQTIEGLGSSTRTGDSYLKQTTHQDHYVNEFGASAFRCFLDYQALPQAKSPASSITWQDLNLSHVQSDQEIPIELKKRYPEIKLIGTFWTPPAWMKANGSEKGYNSGDSQAVIDQKTALNHLLPQYEDHYAYFCAAYVQMMAEHFQAPLYALSIQNELLFHEWYASCVWEPDQYYRVIKKLVQILDERNLPLILFGPEHMTHDSGRHLDFLVPLLADPQIAARFQVAASHGYTNGVEGDLNPESAAIYYKNVVKPRGLRFWMTETSGDPHTLEGALDGVAGALHNALVGGNATLYTYWLANHESAYHGEELFEGMVPQKKSSAFQHYARHVRPGMVRVQALPTSENSLDVSAFIEPSGGRLTVVLNNRQAQAREIVLNVLHDTGLTSFAAWRTSSSQNHASLAAVPINNSGQAFLTLPSQSITTLEAQGGSYPLPSFSLSESYFEVPLAGGPLSIQVDSQPDGFQWAAESALTWIKVTAGATGIGDGTVQLSIVNNRKDEARTGTLTVAGQTVTIRQPGKTQAVSLFRDNEVYPLGPALWYSIPFGYGYDLHYPFVYLWGANQWIYIFPGGAQLRGPGFYFYHFGANHWGWTSWEVAPAYYAFEESGMLERSLAP